MIHRLSNEVIILKYTDLSGLAMFIKASDLCFNYSRATIPTMSHGKITQACCLSALSVSLVSHREQCFICHLEHNEIKEIRGCHRRTSFVSKNHPSDIRHTPTVMTETQLSAHAASACNR